MEPLRAGACSLDFTPDLDGEGTPVWLAGFQTGRRAEGVADPLRVRAFVLEQGGLRLAWVVVDAIGLFASSLDRIRAHPGIQELGLDPLLLTCTHTHAGPDTLGFWSPGGQGPVDALLDRVEATVVRAVCEAARRRTPVRVRGAAARAGEWMRDLVPPVVIDDRLRAICMTDERGVAVATLVHWGNHAEALGPENHRLSADFPGALCQMIEEHLGGVCGFLPGAIGGLITPRGTELRDPTSGALLPPDCAQRATALGRQVATRILGALADAQEEPALLRAWQRRFSVAVTQAGLARAAAGRALPRFEDDRRTQVETECALVQLGRTSLLTAPGEPCPEMVLGGVIPRGGGRRWTLPSLQEVLPGPLWVVSLTNDALGYAVPATQWPEDPGRTVLSPGPGFAASLVRAAQALAREARDENGIPPRPAQRPLARSRR